MSLWELNVSLLQLVGLGLGLGLVLLLLLGFLQNSINIVKGYSLIISCIHNVCSLVGLCGIFSQLDKQDDAIHPAKCSEQQSSHTQQNRVR